MCWYRPAFVILGTIAAALLPWFGALGADNPLAATLARMDGAAAGFQSLSADMRKVSHTAVINEDTVDTGKILVKRGRSHELRMRIDIGQPNPKQVTITGRTAQIYYPNSNSVEEYDLGKYRGVVDAALLLGFGSNSRDLASAYSISLGGPETVSGQKTNRIELIPKSSEVLAHLKRVDLWISDVTGIAVQQKFYEPGGDYSLATYTDMQLNPNIPDSALKLDLPKGVHRAHPQK